MSAIYKHDISEFNNIVNLIKSFKPLKRWQKQDTNNDFTEVTFSFPNWSQLRGDKYKTITKFNEYQKELAKKTLQQWSDVTNINFVEKGTQYDTHIKFGAYNNINELTNDTDHLIGGTAFFPKSYFDSNKKTESVEDYSKSGQIWINLSETKLIKWVKKPNITQEQESKITNFKKGTDKISTYFYEDKDNIFLYKNENNNAHINNDLLAPQSGTYKEHVYRHELGHALGLPHTFKEGDAFKYSPQNSFMYSVMAYNYPQAQDADFNFYFPMSPMLLDVYVIQKFYGQNITTRADNTIYGFNSNTERDFYSLYMPNDIIISCIWDAGGNDTLDFSKYDIEQKIDLNQGAFSDVGGLKSNISIAYGTIIENAIGGKNNDYIIGNKVNNNLIGNQGNDIIYGYDGHDEIYGDQGGDALYGNEGNDFINGGDGCDIISGGNGNNTLIGGKNADIFLFDITDTTNSHNKIMDMNIDEDFIIFIDENRISLNIEKLISQNSISFKMNYLEEDNITRLAINSLEDTNLTIDIVGNFSYEDLFH